MYQFLGKGGQRASRNRKRRRGLFIVLLLLLIFFAGIMTVYRMKGKRNLPGGMETDGGDISDVIFSAAPREDRSLRPRLPMKKIAAGDRKKDDGPMTPKRIPPHPILEIIGPDGKTLLKKK